MTSKVYRPEMSLYRDGQVDPLAKFQWSARAPLINTSTHVLQIQLCHLQSSLLLTFTPRPQLTGTRSSSPLSSPQQVIYVQFICTQ